MEEAESELVSVDAASEDVLLSVEAVPSVVVPSAGVVEELKKYDDDEIYVIGGGKVYEELLPYCDVAHVTKIDFAFEADTHFPNLDENPEWEITASSDEQTYFDLEYTFVKYERK